MVRANERVRHALEGIRTSEIEFDYHCHACKVYDTGTIAVGELARARCRCGSDDLLLLSVAPEPSSPLMKPARPAIGPRFAAAQQ